MEGILLYGRALYSYKLGLITVLELEFFISRGERDSAQPQADSHRLSLLNYRK